MALPTSLSRPFTNYITMGPEESELYWDIETILNRKWFPTFSRSVQRPLFDGPSTRLTQAFSYWWFLWNRIDPSTYPLPEALCLLGTPSNRDMFFLDGHFVHNYNQETLYGIAIREAWDSIPELDRDLMLFAWATRQDYQYDNAHLETVLDDMIDMIEYDLRDNPQLQYLALNLVYQTMKLHEEPLTTNV